MPQLTKQQLESVNQTNFPNNTTGYISPALLREFNTDTIDSLTLQSQFDSVSASFDSRLDAQEAFSSSLAIDYINQSELNAATASLSASLTTTINQKLNSSSFNSYTQSTNGRLDTIETNYANKNAVNTFTQDQIIVGSLEIQESLIVDYSASFGTHVSMSGLDNYGDSRLGANASSINTIIGRTYLPGTLWINNVSWSFYSASIFAANEFIGNNPNLSFQQFSQSVDLRLDNLETFSSSLASTYATDAELAAVSASIMSNFNTFSSSQYKADSSSFNSRINTNSSSLATFSGSQYKADSSSFDSRINTEVSASTFFSGTQYKGDSSSFDSRLDSIEFLDTTFATTGSNNFIGNQTITGSIIGDTNLSIYSQYPGISLQLNANGSGSQYPFGVLTLDSAAWSVDGVIGAWVVQDNPTSQSIGLGINTYTSVYGFPNATPVIYGQGALTGGDDTIIGFPAGRVDLWRNTNLSGSLNITGSLTVNGASKFTGSVVVSGSVSGKVDSLSIVSNTASIDMSKGNFFTLNMVSGSNTFITATNIQPGQTVAVKLAQPPTSLGTVTFDSSKFKFWSGSAQYNTGSQSTGSVDIFTFVTFDTASLWTTIVKNLI